MTVFETQQKILNLKIQNDICILAHSYAAREITEIADFTGDSYALAVRAQSVPNKTIIMCGVRFMAETVKLLSPEKRVVLLNGNALCPMAEQMDPELIKQLQQCNKGYATVAYINTTAELKSLCDVCVTSSSAIKIIRSMPEKNILFIPDINLGTYIKEQCPDKNIKLVSGGCPTHCRASDKHVKKAKAEHPNAKLLVHPECLPEVWRQADYVGSTSGIINYAVHCENKEFIIGTENSICEYLQYECPDKRFYPLSKDLVCHNMKLSTLPELLLACKGEFGEEIHIKEDIKRKAIRSVDNMLRYGG